MRAWPEQRIQSFEAEIAQPLVLGTRGRPPASGNLVPEQDLERVSGQSWNGSTNTGYLMARLQRVDPEIAGRREGLGQ